MENALMFREWRYPDATVFEMHASEQALKMTEGF